MNNLNLAELLILRSLLITDIKQDVDDIQRLMTFYGIDGYEDEIECRQALVEANSTTVLKLSRLIRHEKKGT